jgi:hypothetical protein
MEHQPEERIRHKKKEVDLLPICPAVTLHRCDLYDKYVMHIINNRTCEASGRPALKGLIFRCFRVNRGEVALTVKCTACATRTLARPLAIVV